MSAIGGWLGTGAAVIVIGLAVLLMKFGHNLPSASHPWLHRAVIVGMYCAGSVLVITTVGQWLLHLLQHLGGLVGGTTPGSGLGWALVTYGGLLLAATLLVSLIWAPDLGVAYMALFTPLMLALAPAGFVHEIYTFTAAPAQELVTWLASWAGG